MQQLRWKIILFCVKHSNTYLNLHHKITQLLRKKNNPKVFCIGDVKTGTSSLYKALKILGYRTVRVFKWGEILNRKFDIYLE
jgi:folate-dependent tRNA-U54 methylase TrmFO/GidA